MLRRPKSVDEDRILELCGRSCRRIGVTDARFVVAVSGGPDSLALADVLYRLSDELNIEVVLAYVDHRLRGPRASRAERRALSRFASVRGLALEIKELAPEALTASEEGVEAAARTHRYAKLADVVSAYDAGGIVLAHHMRDQVETLLMRLVSGTTVEGAAGMRERSERAGVPILRPLLEIDGQDLRRYAATRRLKPVFDRTNRDRRRLRSRIRRDLLPVLEQTRPGALEAVARSAGAMGEAADALASTVSDLDLFGVHSRSATSAQALNASRHTFFALPPALRLRSLHEAVSVVSGRPDYRIPRRFFRALLGSDTFPARNRVAVGYGVELYLDTESLWVSRPDVVPNTQTQYLQLIDAGGNLLREKLPHPFTDVSVFCRNTGDSDCTRGPVAAESGAQVRLWCVPPVAVRPATPADGGAFGLKRSAFKREMQRDPASRMVVADSTGNRALLVRRSAGPVELFEGTDADGCDQLCICLRADSGIVRGDMNEHESTE